MVIIMVFSFAACNSAAIKDEADRGTVTVYVDGKETLKFTVADFAKKTSEQELDGDKYYGKTLSDVISSAVDANTIKAAFTKSTDGYACYFNSVADVFIATYKANDAGEFESIKDDSGKDGFTALNTSSKAKFVSDIYLLTKPVDFKVEVLKDGASYKTITIDEFMSLKPQYTALQHKYNGGADNFEGEFLAVDAKTMFEYLQITPRAEDDGTKLEFYDAAGKVNTDLKSDPTNEKSIWNSYFYVLVNGSTFHDITQVDVGFTSILDGTGIRWMVSSMSKMELTSAK